MSAAPLKGQGWSNSERNLFSLRVHVSAAPLKGKIVAMVSICRGGSPRSCERGPIEGFLSEVFPLFLLSSPRSCERGPIEGRWRLVQTSGPLRSLRVHVSAAPLKARVFQSTGQPCSSLRVHVSAAPLKAICLQLLCPMRSALRVHVSAAPLKALGTISMPLLRGPLSAFM